MGELESMVAFSRWFMQSACRAGMPTLRLIGSCTPANLRVPAPMPGAAFWREELMQTISSITAALEERRS
jgi:hypothetical protein